MGWPGQLLPALRPARTYTIQRSGGAVSFPPPPLRRGPEADHGPRHPVEDGAEGPHGDQVEQGRLGSAALRPEREQHVDPAAEAVGGGPGGEWEHIGAGALGDEPGGRAEPESEAGDPPAEVDEAEVDPVLDLPEGRPLQADGQEEAPPRPAGARAGGLRTGRRARRSARSSAGRTAGAASGCGTGTAPSAWRPR